MDDLISRQTLVEKLCDNEKEMAITTKSPVRECGRKDNV